MSIPLRNRKQAEGWQAKHKQDRIWVTPVEDYWTHKAYDTSNFEIRYRPGPPWLGWIRSWVTFHTYGSGDPAHPFFDVVVRNCLGAEWEDNSHGLLLLDPEGVERKRCELMLNLLVQISGPP